MRISAIFSSIAILLFICRMAAGQVAADVPHLSGQAAVTQLIVDGKPFLVLAGEVHNSSSSSLDYMSLIWPKLEAAHLNTVLVPVSWELVEPEEGKFDFALVDGLIRDARQNNLRLGLLWFGTWKNMVSSYAPVWVRGNPGRFPCAVDEAGDRLPILSTFSDAGCEADSRAFAALMRHVKELEEGQPRKTVLMVQVENEVGLSGGTRDHSRAANDAFAGQVPQELMDQLLSRDGGLGAEIGQSWLAAGGNRSGTWERVFGSGVATNEVFMAWNYARYIGKVIGAGKAEYPIPMFVNASVGRQDGKTGTYPSGGPVPQVTAVWRVAAPQLDMLCPDIYYGNFGGWCEKYTAAGNPLFIPEMRGGAEGVINTLTAIAQYGAIGGSPFGIESAVEPADEFSNAYGILSQLSSLVLKNQGKETMAFAVLNGAEPGKKLPLGQYTLNLQAVRVRNLAPENPAGTPATTAPAARSYALAINVAPDEYLVAGRGVQITFAPNPPAAEVAAVASIDEGTFRNGQWSAGRRLNGDETMLSYSLSQLAADNQTGTGARFPSEKAVIYRIKMIRYPASRAATTKPVADQSSVR